MQIERMGEKVINIITPASPCNQCCAIRLCFAYPCVKYIHTLRRTDRVNSPEKFTRKLQNATPLMNRTDLTILREISAHSYVDRLGKEQSVNCNANVKTQVLNLKSAGTGIYQLTRKRNAKQRQGFHIDRPYTTLH
jgi:hypothetical protein